jgi:hypothetical protein
VRRWWGVEVDVRWRDGIDVARSVNGHDGGGIDRSRGER